MKSHASVAAFQSTSIVNPLCAYTRGLSKCPSQVTDITNICYQHPDITNTFTVTLDLPISLSLHTSEAPLESSLPHSWLHESHLVV